jgi:hypothetical protein
VSIGAFPALLPEIGATAVLADWQLGAVAGAFGLARMASNVPVGLFITHHLTRALVLSPGLMLVGAALVSVLPATMPWSTALLITWPTVAARRSCSAACCSPSRCPWRSSGSARCR